MGWPEVVALSAAYMIAVLVARAPGTVWTVR